MLQKISRKRSWGNTIGGVVKFLRAMETRLNEHLKRACTPSTWNALPRHLLLSSREINGGSNFSILKIQSFPRKNFLLFSVAFRFIQSSRRFRQDNCRITRRGENIRNRHLITFNILCKRKWLSLHSTYCRKEGWKNNIWEILCSNIVSNRCNFLSRLFTRKKNYYVNNVYVHRTFQTLIIYLSMNFTLNVIEIKMIETEKETFTFVNCNALSVRNIYRSNNILLNFEKKKEEEEERKENKRNFKFQSHPIPNTEIERAGSFQSAVQFPRYIKKRTHRWKKKKGEEESQGKTSQRSTCTSSSSSQPDVESTRRIFYLKAN